MWYCTLLNILLTEVNTNKKAIGTFNQTAKKVYLNNWKLLSSTPAIFLLAFRLHRKRNARAQTRFLSITFHAIAQHLQPSEISYDNRESLAH